MNLPQVYMCSPSWTLLPPPSPYHPSGSSQCTSPKHPVSCIEPGLTTRFIHDILHVSMPFSQNTSAAQQEKERTETFYINTFPPGPTHRLQGRTALPGHTHNCVRLLSLRRECWYFVIQPHLQMLWIGCGLEESEQTPPFVSYKSGGVLGFLRTWVWLLKVI